jgi:outer membrane protein OmpA-like peptidoglycan-associated protein
MFALLLVVGFSNANAQDNNNPWQFSFGANAVDLYPVGEDAPLGDYFDEYFNVNDHWNALPLLTSFTISKYMGENFSFGITGSVNKIRKIGDATSSRDMPYFGVDGIVKYNVGSALNWSKLQPYLGVGGGYSWIDKIGAGTLNGTVGLNYWFNENWGLMAQSTYKHSFEDYLPKHFQHTVGVAFNFGGKDTDGDGIYDKDDACPEVAGLPAFNGCPDSDGDGVPDNADNCPNTPGLKSLAGCPDADGDGVADHKDKCPDVAGPAANDGCPWPDTDGDGVLDKDDKCPNEVGTVANNGCPEIKPTPAVMATLNEYARTILFDTGKATFKKESLQTLGSMQAIFKEYPKADFSIEGHTDSVGSEKSNQLLSERRANAVRDWLIANGINQDRLTAVGLGESTPIDDNKTAAGRTNNRRVEVKLK